VQAACPGAAIECDGDAGYRQDNGADCTEAGVGGSYFTRILRLSFLAPDVVKAILSDRHPIELTAKRLANEIQIPIAWSDQSKLLGAG